MHARKASITNEAPIEESNPPATMQSGDSPSSFFHQIRSNGILLQALRALNAAIRRDHATGEEAPYGPRGITDRHRVKPTQWADVHSTLSGETQYQDPENPRAWITSNTVLEVRR